MSQPSGSPNWRELYIRASGWIIIAMFLISTAIIIFLMI